MGPLVPAVLFRAGAPTVELLVDFPGLSELVSSFGRAGLAKVLFIVGTLIGVGSDNFLTIFCPGCFRPDGLTVALALLGCPPPRVSCVSSLVCCVLVSRGILICEGSRPGAPCPDVGKRLFSFEGGFLDTYSTQCSTDVVDLSAY